MQNFNVDLSAIRVDYSEFAFNARKLIQKYFCIFEHKISVKKICGISRYGTRALTRIHSYKVPKKEKAFIMMIMMIATFSDRRVTNHGYQLFFFLFSGVVMKEKYF